jgi:glyoxylase-like metal-dependent hydrolase (beta-lactamase superfamily II)|tara:strand:+ start:2527 stop:3555 length:1029 start_codon:yes stop_codon:yes gene_type:complete
LSVTAQSLALSPPEAGCLNQVADRLYWLRMPLPYQLDHINLWLADEGDSWTLIDCGINHKAVLDIWRQLFADLFTAKPLRRIVCTHCHPDHMGLAGWLADEWDAEFVATRAEWSMGRLLSIEGAHDAELHRKHYIENGCGGEFADKGVERFAETPKLYASVPSRFTSIRAGSVIRMAGQDWRVIVGLGHAFEQACLYSEMLNVLIAGDQILPRITPAIFLQSHDPKANPLHDFLDSNRQFRGLPADTTVLPSHHRPFQGLHERLDDYVRHHQERLAESVAICARPMTAFEVSQQLFTRELDQHQAFFAIGETLAHLRYLEVEGRLARTIAGGIARYAAASEN